MKYRSIIEDYFLRNLKGQQLEEFKSELETNSDLKREYNIYKKAIDFVLSQEKKLFSDIGKMEDFEFNLNHFSDINNYGTREPLKDGEKGLIKILNDSNSFSNRASVVKSYFLRYYKIAAAFLLTLCLIFLCLYFFPSFSTNNEDLFKKYYSKYNHSLIYRSISESDSKTLSEAVALYDKQKYDQAYRKLANIPDSLKTNPEIFILEGISLIELGRITDAIPRFEKIKEDHLLYTNSLWYIGLCYLQKGEHEKAKTVFLKLKNYRPYYYNETKKILRFL